jgi:hypothetical protein
MGKSRVREAEAVAQACEEGTYKQDVRQEVIVPREFLLMLVLYDHRR